ncbi:hypothetical protein AB0D86_49875 [Streptomyces sp. NPDC048324]|uniref:hypothetical protein n=1 Tax=Streptomyces sp. NPDC048324 TaxID=3157205 RepID=UPI0034265D99
MSQQPPCPRNVSPWHWGWQLAAPLRDQQRGAFIADAITALGIFVEIQFSKISSAHIAVRERHWGNLVWIFDARGPHADGRLRFTPPTSSAPISYAWSRPPQYLSQCHRPIFLDLGDSPQFGLHLLYRLPDLYDRDSGLGHLYTAESVRQWMRYGTELTPWYHNSGNRRRQAA